MSALACKIIICGRDLGTSVRQTETEITTEGNLASTLINNEIDNIGHVVETRIALGSPVSDKLLTSAIATIEQYEAAEEAFRAKYCVRLQEHREAMQSALREVLEKINDGY